MLECFYDCPLPNVRFCVDRNFKMTIISGHRPYWKIKNANVNLRYYKFNWTQTIYKNQHWKVQCKFLLLFFVDQTSKMAVTTWKIQHKALWRYFSYSYLKPLIHLICNLAATFSYGSHDEYCSHVIYNDMKFSNLDLDLI